MWHLRSTRFPLLNSHSVEVYAFVSDVSGSDLCTRCVVLSMQCTIRKKCPICLELLM